MQRIISFLGHILSKNLLVLGLVSLISLSGAFFFAAPGYAASSSAQDSAQERMSESSKTGQAQQTYEQFAKDARDAVKNPQALDEEYDKDKKIYKQQQGKGGLIDGAKTMVKKAIDAE